MMHTMKHDFYAQDLLDFKEVMEEEMGQGGFMTLDEIAILAEMACEIRYGV